ADIVQLRERAGAYDVVGGGVRGHDVGRVAAVGDDAVDAVALPDVLPPEADRRLRDRERIGGVDPELREGGRVRRPARVADLEVPPRQGRRLDHVGRRRMYHHGRVHAREDAALEEEDLAAAALLRWGAEDDHREA